MIRTPKGFSTTTVLLTLGISVGSVSYIITNLLPKLQSERVKASKAISYQVFMSSLSEYMVHALRDRWCLEVNSNGETNLLQSSIHCLKSSSMEDVVTYQGNLERLLWDDTTIGTNYTTPKISILATNQSRRDQKKTSRILTKQEVEVTSSQLSFTVTNSTLSNMTRLHPLYSMTQGVKQCIDKVEITLSLVKDANNQPLGEEKKVSIKIKPIVGLVTSMSKSCGMITDIESTTYYTLYPRRLHTLSLLKYGNLDASFDHEYNGPVYVAGHVALPETSSRPELTSIFKNKLILGMFNGGSSNQYWAGKIVESDGKTEHTNFLRADPVLSKQNSYAGFRGFLGGVSYDSTEDRGFYNLFNSTSQDTQSQERLQQCLEEQKYLVDESMNNNSQFGYKLVPDPSKIIIDLGLSLRNRFRPKDNTIVNAINTTSQNTDKSSNVFPLAFQANQGGGPIGSVSVTYTRKDYSNPKKVKSVTNQGITSQVSAFDVGFGIKGETINQTGTNFRIKINGTFFYNQLNEALKVLNNCFEYDLFPATAPNHPLYKLPEYTNYVAAAKDYADKIGDTGNNNNGKEKENSNKNKKTNVTCMQETDDPDLQSLQTNYESSLSNLKNKLEMLKVFFEKLNENSPVYTDAAEMIISLNSLRNSLTSDEKIKYKNNLVLNQNRLIIEPSQKWKDLFADPFKKEYVEYEVGQINLSLKLEDLSAINRVLNLALDTNNFLSFYLSSENELLKFWSSATDGLFTTTLWNGVKFDSSVVQIPKNTMLPLGNFTSSSEIYKGTQINTVYELNCPEGLGLADWDLDMSQSSNFAWNFANTPAGVDIQKEQNQNAPFAIFAKAPSMNEYPTEGSPRSYTKSVVTDCIVESDRDSIYGFYVCQNLTIKASSIPLIITGTFIVNNIINEGRKVYWYSLWDPSSANRILTDFYSKNINCQKIANNQSTLKLSDVLVSKTLGDDAKSCSALNLVINGPNNFTWTTVDPEIGLASPSDISTSQKINRVMKWIIREEAKTERIK